MKPAEPVMRRVWGALGIKSFNAIGLSKKGRNCLVTSLVMGYNLVKEAGGEGGHSSGRMKRDAYRINAWDK